MQLLRDAWQWNQRRTLGKAFHEVLAGHDLAGSEWGVFEKNRICIWFPAFFRFLSNRWKKGVCPEMESTEPQLSPIFAQFYGGQYSRSSGFGVNTEILGDRLSEHSSANFISSATFISRLVWFGMTWVQNVLLLTSWSLSLVLAASQRWPFSGADT